MKPKLNYNQSVFVSEFLRHRNATQAALKAYPEATYHSARMIGSENLSKPAITSAIEEALRDDGLTIESALRTLKEAMQADNQKGNPDWAVRLKAVDMVLRLGDLYPRNGKESTTGSQIDRQRVDELRKEPLEVLHFAMDNGRMPNEEERRLLHGEVSSR